MLGKARLRLPSVALIALCAAVVVACGGDDQQAAGGNGGAAADSPELAAFNAEIERLVAEGSEDQSGRPPTSGPAAEPGKNVVVISCDQRAEGCRRNVTATEEAAAVAGWRTTLINAAGDVTRMANGFRRAIDINADGVAAISMDSAFFPDVLMQAKQAGLALVCWVCGNDPPLYDDVITDSDTYDEDGYLATAAAYQMVDGDLKMLMMEEKDFAVVRDRSIGARRFVEECQQAGGSCEILGAAEFGLNDITTSAPQKAVNLARTNPDANVFWSAYDAAATFQFQALAQANLQRDMIGVAFDGNEANLDDIRNPDGFQKITIGLPATWDGFGFIDNINRKIQGEKVVDQNVRSKLLTPDNVPAEGAWDGDIDVEPLYREMWGG